MSVVKPADESKVNEEGGRSGRREMWQVALALLPVLVTAMSQSNFVFAAAATSYRCIIQECEKTPTAALPPWWPPDVEPQCSRPLLNTNYTTSFNHSAQITNCSTNMFTNQSQTCDSWIYQNDNSIVSEFDLACQEWKRALVGTVHNVGVFIAMPVMGYFSDRWGRRLALTLSASGAASGALKPLVTWAMAGGGYSAHARYYVYLALELLEAALATGTYTTAFVFMVEMLGESYRVASSVCLGVGIATGELILAAIAWRLPHWTYLQLAVYCPALLFPGLRLLLKESPRWTRAVTNKSKAEPVEKFSVKVLLRYPTLLKRVAICCWWWFTSAFVYYGLMINSTGLPGEPVRNFALTSLATLPGEFLAGWALRRFGRPRTLGVGLLLVGCCCCATALVPDGMSWLHISLYLVGKSNIALCFNAVYTYTSELMPTVARGSLVGVCSTTARLGSVLAPLTPLLSAHGTAVPTVLFGSAALSGAVLTLLTPDTRHCRLPDTVLQANALH